MHIEVTFRAGKSSGLAPAPSTLFKFWSPRGVLLERVLLESIDTGVKPRYARSELLTEREEGDDDPFRNPDAVVRDLCLYTDEDGRAKGLSPNPIGGFVFFGPARLVATWRCLETGYEMYSDVTKADLDAVPGLLALRAAAQRAAAQRFADAGGNCV